MSGGTVQNPQVFSGVNRIEGYMVDNIQNSFAIYNPSMDIVENVDGTARLDFKDKNDITTLNISSIISPTSRTTDIINQFRDAGNLYVSGVTLRLNTKVTTENNTTVKENWINTGSSTVRPYDSTHTRDILTIGTLENGDITFKGANTFTGINTVPKPANNTGTTSLQAVNVGWVNDATAGVNNIVHKSGDELINGLKSFNGTTVIRTGQRRHDAPMTPGNTNGISIIGSDGYEIAMYRARVLTDGNTRAEVVVYNSDGTFKIVDLGTGDVV